VCGAVTGGISSYQSPQATTTPAAKFSHRPSPAFPWNSPAKPLSVLFFSQLLNGVDAGRMDDADVQNRLSAFQIPT